MGTFDLHIVPDAEAIAQKAADEFVARAQAAIKARGFFAVALSGGSTPKRLFALLAERSAAAGHKLIDWNAVQLFWGDERHVAPDHADSNFRMTNENLISKIPIPPQNVRRIRGEEKDAAKAAAEYQTILADFFSQKKRTARGLARFDLVLLGMGADGHTASIFPGSTAVKEEKDWVHAPFVQKFNSHRITLTAPVLSNADRILFLVGGADKAETLEAVLQGPYRPDTYPSQLIRPTDGELTWVLDEAAAKLVK